jgi:hypothetical protein
MSHSENRKPGHKQLHKDVGIRALRRQRIILLTRRRSKLKTQKLQSKAWLQSLIYFCLSMFVYLPIPVAARSKAWVCGRSSAEIVGSNPSGGIDICLL